MTIDEQIAILNAYKDGKTIQLSDIDAEEWFDINDGDHEFNFSGYDYRIKPEEPEPKYRPYTEEELIEEIRRRGNWLKNKSSGINYAIVSFDGETMHIYGHSIGLFFGEVMDSYAWTDGTPFGKLEGE